MIQEREQAPVFSAEATTGTVDLAAMTASGPVVIYFFPKANTSG